MRNSRRSITRSAKKFTKQEKLCMKKRIEQWFQFAKIDVGVILWNSPYRMYWSIVIISFQNKYARTAIQGDPVRVLATRRYSAD